MTMLRLPLRSVVLVAALLVVPIGSVLLFVPIASIVQTVFNEKWNWLAIGEAVAFYSLAHVLRALRLALIAAPALRLKARTVAYLHLHTAPVSFVVPLKIGEIYRWLHLAWLSGDSMGAFVLLLIERMLDTIILLFLMALVYAGTQHMSFSAFAASGVLLAITIAGLVALSVAPSLLMHMQNYILKRHSARRAIRTLAFIDSTRIILHRAHESINGNVALLLTLSAMIWTCECAVIASLAQRLSFDSDIIEASLLSARSFLEAGGLGASRLYTLTFLLSFLLLWPWATVCYLTRLRKHERSQNTERNRPLPFGASYVRLHNRRIVL